MTTLDAVALRALNRSKRLIIADIHNILDNEYFSEDQEAAYLYKLDKLGREINHNKKLIAEIESAK